MKKIVIVDYQLGNIFSIMNACQKIGIQPVLSNNPEDIKIADGLILPGVGAFENAMVALRERNLVQPLIDYANSGKPMMGICLGMQLLFDTSYEFGKHQGLGLIPGEVLKFPAQFKDEILKVPHIGWNKIFFKNENAWKESPFSTLPQGAYSYFIHSYYVLPKSSDAVLSVTNYGGFEYCSSVKTGNIFATQFHPEKSGEVGISIIRNWLEKI